MLTWDARYPSHTAFNFDSALCIIICALLGENGSCNACEDAGLISVLALEELVYYLLSLPLTIDPFFAVNSVRGLQIPAVVATENAPFTQPALVEASRRGGGIGKAQSTERTRQRRTVDLLCTSCPDIMATLSATADGTDNLTFETARECAIPPFISPIAQRPSLDGAEKPIMREAPLMEGTFIKFSNFR